MSSGSEVDVVLAADAAYLPWAVTTMLSALERNPPGMLRFHLLHDGSVCEHDAKRLRTFVAGRGGTVDMVAVHDDRIEALRPAAGGGRVTWFRLLVPDLLPDLPRVLLLDADTFVADALTALWQADLGDDPIAAVANVVEPGKKAHVRLLGIDDSHRYFNAGVLVMDLERMRMQDATSEMLRYASENAERTSWLDQDVLNVVFSRHWRPLHPRWNAMNSLWNWTEWANAVFGEAVVSEAKTSPGVLHFEGPSVCKPWHYLSMHPLRRLYRETLRQTPWGKTPLSDRTVLTRLIRLAPESWRVRAYMKLRGQQALK